MVFSLFGRKDKSDARKPRETRALVGAGGESTLPAPPTRPSLEVQRQMAQATARKIDQIEAEILDGRVPASAGVERSPAPAPTIPATPEPQGRGQDTSVVLGDAAGAFAIDVDGSALPLLLEEAAILFANGQSEAAAATLRQAIAGEDLGANLLVAWWMLLDVMQASGDRAEFDRLGLDFSNRFQQPPPAWRDDLSPSAVARPASGAMPPKRAVAAPTAPAAAAPPPAGTIVLAGALDVGVVRAVKALQTLAADPAVTPTLDFGRASSVDAAAAALLTKALQAFKSSGRALQVAGASRLLEVAQAAILAGRRDDPDACWWLALETLRLLDRRQAFEDLAIDYCVTYEVSPPSWEPMPPCVRVHESGTAPSVGGDAPVPAAAAAPAAAVAKPVVPVVEADSVGVPEGAFALRGDLVGRLGPVSRALREAVAERNDLVIDCRSLRRVDFVAAGELLNEIAAIRTASKTVLFAEPTAIVHALFIVMGIHDLAEVRRRRH